ncbi:MAG: TonB family protein [Terriglobales bacterium]
MRAVDVPRVDTPSVLTLVAQQAAYATGAHGVAIAIGNAMAMCCCASIGDAPPVGVLVGPDSGLSGICMRSSEVVQCDDVTTDSRIDRGASQQMSLRSVLIVPVIVDGRLQGMLQAVSHTSRAFAREHRELLCRMAERIASLLSDPKAAQHPVPLVTEEEALSPPPAADDELPAQPALPSGAGAHGGDTAVVQPPSSFTPPVIPRPAAVPVVPNACESERKGPSPAVLAEPPYSRRPVSARRTVSPAMKAAVVIAMIAVLGIAVYEFTALGRSSTPAATPVSAGTSNSDANGTDAPDISIEQSSLAVGLESTPGGAANELTPGRLLRKVEPVFPPAARGVSGSVVLSALVNKDGRVANVRVVRGPEELGAPAAEAVRQWVYEPYRLGGVPVAAESMITIKVAPRKQR